MKKIGIVTVYKNINFGSNLQTYALQQILLRLGYQPENLIVTDIQKNYFVYCKRIYHLIVHVIKSFSKLNRVKYRRNLIFKRYVSDNIRSSDYSCSNIETLEKKGEKKFDYYICGSDQIWAPNQFNPFFFLSFCKDKSRNIAYAPSIGLTSIPENLVKPYCQLLQNIGALSIREKDGASLIKSLLNIDIPVVLDPTLLLNRNDWLSHSSSKYYPISCKYILCYFLGNNYAQREKVKRLSEVTGYNIFVLPSNRYDCKWGNKQIYEAGPQEFINLLDQAEVLCTDSFHGTIFSINLHKPFFTFLRFNDDDPLNQNSRVLNFLDETGLQSRIITEEKEIPFNFYENLDWGKIDSYLEEKRIYSIKFLQSSLQ